MPDLMYLAGASASPYHVTTATLLNCNMLLKCFLSGPLYPSLPHLTLCFYLITLIHILPSPGTSSSVFNAHLEASRPTSFLDFPHFAKLLGAILNARSMDEFQEVGELFSTL